MYCISVVSKLKEDLKVQFYDQLVPALDAESVLQDLRNVGTGFAETYQRSAGINLRQGLGHSGGNNSF